MSVTRSDWIFHAACGTRIPVWFLDCWGQCEVEWLMYTGQSAYMIPSKIYQIPLSIGFYCYENQLPSGLWYYVKGAMVFRGNCWLNMKSCGTRKGVPEKEIQRTDPVGQKMVKIPWFTQCKLKIEQIHLSHHLVWCKHIEEAVVHVRCKKTDVSDILHTAAPKSVIKCTISSQLVMFPSKSLFDQC